MKRITLVLLMLCVILTGCFGNADSTPEAKVVETPQPVDTIIQPVVSESGTTTVFDLKKKYGTEKNTSLMPLYNVDRDHIFTFKFASRLPDDVSYRDIVSVHTDIKALPESEIYALIGYEDFRAQDTIYIKPSTGVLTSSQLLSGDIGGWGNAPIYYIRINYDLNASTPTKLDNPIIIPFTLKTEVPVPTSKYNITPDGNFELHWSAVEGATSYRVYQVYNSFGTGTENEPVYGPEQGYAVSFPLLQAEVTDSKLTYFLSGNAPDPEDDYVISQNQGVRGDYYVTAVIGNKESNFSNVVSTHKLSPQIPAKLVTNIGFEHYADLAALPASAEVAFIDGSRAFRDFIYDYENVNLADPDYYGPRLYYTVKGTSFRGYVEIENLTQDDLDAAKRTQKQESASGYVAPENLTEYVPAPDVPTIIGTAVTDPNVTEAQKSNTQRQVEEGNQANVPLPQLPEDVKLNADSALEEYLALSLIDAADTVSLKAFPEAQNFETLTDVVSEVIYQNPLILGVKGWRYDYRKLTLEFIYDYARDEIKKMQQEIVTEAGKIVSTIIKSDMSVEDKHKAIYDYLNDNTRYDVAALENAEANDFQKVDARFNDSFNTYGITVKKVGVCASYAATYKLLSDLAGLESIVVTGDMDGVPHAWNKIKLDNGWVHVDSTNNATNSGVPYLLFNANDDTAEALDFTLSNEYWVDHEIAQFASKDGSKDYYNVNGLEVSTPTAYGAKLREQLQAGNTYVAIRYAGQFNIDDILDEAREAVDVLNEAQLDNLVMGTLSNYIIVEY